MDNGEINAKDDIAPVAMGLNEIYRVFEEPEPKPKDQVEKESKENVALKRRHPIKLALSKLVDDAKKQQLLSNEIQKDIGKLAGPTMFFTEYKGKKYPKENERNFMLHLEHTFSDIPCLPITPYIADAINAGKQPFDEYLAFIKGSIEWLKSYRKKPIMGIIVNFGYTKLEQLLKLYSDQEINAFCIDFDGHTPMSHKSVLAQCYRILGDKTENSFFYAINVNEGRFIHNKVAINAKDILAFGYGLDGMGRRHRPPHFPTKEMQEKLGPRWRPLDRKQNKVRLFIKTEYGYYKVLNASEIRNYPKDTKIPLSTFTKNPNAIDLSVRHSQKIFNMEQLALEASALRSVIEKEMPSEYLGSKTLIDPKDIKQIKKFKDTVQNPQKSFEEIL
jgi:hypothetical protein